MRQKTWMRFLAGLAVLLALSGCVRPAPAATAQATPSAAVQSTAAQADSASPASAVAALLGRREQAVNAQDGEAYLATVLPGDAVLQKEESDLIRAAEPLDVQDFRLAADSVAAGPDGGLTATVTQSYTVGSEQRGCTFQAAFQYEGGRLYWAGPAFEVKTRGPVRVCYTGDDGELAQALLDSETKILAAFKDQLGFQPQGTISIKLFHDQQVFLQSVKLDLPAWVGGWHEFGESIKTFTGGYGSDPANYESMLAHESTHRMVSELSNDNACYWLQEGMAGIYESQLLHPGDLLTAEELQQQYTPYAQQKTINLEKIGVDDRDAVSLYYATSKAYAAFLLDRYGWEKVRQMLEYMKKDALIPVTGAEKITQTNARTSAAISAVLGLDDAGFQKKFDQWLEEGR